MSEFRSTIVGVKYNVGAPERLSQTEPGTRAELVREPDNPHDANAVAVHVGGVKCGFLPREQAAGVAADMDAGKTVTARVYDYNKLNIEVSDEPSDDAA